MTDEKLLREKKNKMERLFSYMFETKTIDGSVCFLFPDGSVGKILELFMMIGLEYADSLEQAESGVFIEDGDLYDPNLPDAELLNCLLADAGVD